MTIPCLRFHHTRIFNNFLANARHTGVDNNRGVELENDMLPHVSRRVIKRGFKDPHADIININKHHYIPGHGTYFLRYKISYGRYKPADVRCRDSRCSKSTLSITHVGDCNYCETTLAIKSSGLSIYLIVKFRTIERQYHSLPSLSRH